MLAERIRRYLLSFGVGQQYEMVEFTEVRPWWLFWKEPRRRYEGRAILALGQGREMGFGFTIDGARNYDAACRAYMAALQEALPAARAAAAGRQLLPPLHTAGTFYPEAPR